MQIIKYKWEDWKPQLVVKDESKTIKMPLMEMKISCKIGKKMCIGFFRDGKHYLCRGQRSAEDRQCNECRLEDDYFFCIRCDGSSCTNPKKRDECKKNYYYIYLAAFDSVLKVGISYERRIMERLVEQGADFGAKIARVQDGMAVRQIEQRIKKEVNLVDRLTGTQKNKMIFGNPNASIASIFKAINALRSNGTAKYLIQPEIYDMRQYYGLENIMSRPREISVEDDMNIDGKVVAAKGNLLIIQEKKDFMSINAHSLLGRHITI